MVNIDHVLTIAAAVSPVLVPVGLAVYHIILGQLPAAKREKAEAVVGTVVRAVEQMYAAAPGSADTKKAEAVRLAHAMGVNVSPATLDLLIEAAVASLPQKVSGSALVVSSVTAPASAPDAPVAPAGAIPAPGSFPPNGVVAPPPPSSGR